MNIHGINLRAAIIAHDTPDIGAFSNDQSFKVYVTEEAKKFIDSKHPAADGATFEQVYDAFAQAFQARLDEVRLQAIRDGKRALDSGREKDVNDFADRMKRLGFYK